MKRLCLTLLILLLAAGCGLAETRESVIYLEGEPEPVTETLYETPWGFYFWYDAELFTVDDSPSESGQSLLLFPKDSDLPVYLEIMTPKAVGIPAERYLTVNAEDDTEYDEDFNEHGVTVKGYVKDAPFSEDILQGFYTMVSWNDQWAAAYISCPVEAWEGYGHRLCATLNTMSFSPLPAVRVDDGEDRDDLPSIVVSDDDYCTWVMFTARRPVTDFQVLALEMKDLDNEEIAFDTESVYEMDELNPEEPVRISLTFWGDMPNNGIAFTDEDDETHCFAVDMSGENGELYLWEF